MLAKTKKGGNMKTLLIYCNKFRAFLIKTISPSPSDIDFPPLVTDVILKINRLSGGLIFLMQRFLIHFIAIELL